MIGGNYTLFRILDGREHFYQWDIDRKLVIEDRSITQVHFCNKTGECSLVCEPFEEAGLWVVNVPNILLQDIWRINVYAYDGTYTKHSAIFTVSARTKPDSYVYTETEILNYNTLLERIENVEANGGGGGCIIGDSVEEIHIGTEAPTDENIKVWINPEESLKDEFATVGYVDNAVGSLPNYEYIDNALSGFGEGYYTKAEIDEALTNIPSSGGGTGCDVYYFEGCSYAYFTDNDKAKIQEIWDYAEANDGKLMPTTFYYKGTTDGSGAWRTITYFFKGTNYMDMCYVQTQNNQMYGFRAYDTGTGSLGFSAWTYGTAFNDCNWYWDNNVSDSRIMGVDSYRLIKVVGYWDNDDTCISTFEVTTRNNVTFAEDNGACYTFAATDGANLITLRIYNSWGTLEPSAASLNPDDYNTYTFHPIGYYYWRG